MDAFLHGLLLMGAGVVLGIAAVLMLLTWVQERAWKEDEARRIDAHP